MDGTWSSFATSSRGAGMPSGEVPRLRVVAGGGLSGGATGRSSGGALHGGRLRAVGDVPAESMRPGGGGVFDWRAELELVAPDVLLPPGSSRQAIAAAEGSLGWAL